MLIRAVRIWAASVLVRGIRWRLTGSVLTVITAAIAVGTAIVGPLYLQAGGDSLVRRAVATAPLSSTSFTFASEPSRSPTLDQLVVERRALLGDEHLTGLYGNPVQTISSGVNLLGRDGNTYRAGLDYRSGICSVLHFSAGGCATRPRDAVVSARTARTLGVTVGSTVTTDNIQGQDPVQIRITGVFENPNLRSGYWFGDGTPFFQFGNNTGRPSFIPEVDDLFVASAAAFSVPSSYRPLALIESPLRPGVLGISDASTVAHEMQAMEQRASDAGFTITSVLPSLIAGTLHQKRLMGTIVVVAALQLVLLAIWVLTSVLLRSADRRRAELRVARLRGFPPRALIAVSVIEPASLCVIGAALGIVGAWVVVRVAASILFTPGSVIRPDLWTYVSFGAVLVTICAVLGLSANRLLLSSGLGAASPQAGTSRSRAVVDVAILVVSVVALVGAATSGALSSHSDPVAAAAPAVVALGTSVIAIRVVEFLCRRLSNATLDSRAVASFLAVRRIGRRPAALREARTLVIAVGLACFAVSAWSVARANRLTAATFSVGARTVVTVTADDRKLDRVVDAVDPGGRFAMAAVEISTSSTALIAVDATRLAAVAAWPSGTTRQSVAAVSRALAPRTAPQVNLPNGALAISARVSGSGPALQDLGHLDLSAWLFDPVDGTRIVNLGRLRAGTSAYRSTAQPGCPCRLVGIGVLPSSERVPSTGQIDLGLSALSSPSATGTPHIDRAELSPTAWRSTAAGLRVVADTSGVGFDIPMTTVSGAAGAYESSAPVMASIADHPTEIPAVAGRGAASLAMASGQDESLSEQDLDGNTVDLHPVITATSLPRIGRGGALVDLGMLERTQVDPSSSEITSEQVWLGSRAPANAVNRLRAAGLQIDDVQRSSTLVSQAGHSGPALAYDFMLLATIVALLVAAVGTFSLLAAGSRQRATEMVALEVTGVRRPILARSLAVEAAILALTALFGVVAGVSSAAIALPSLPQLAAGTQAPLSYALPVLLILAVALGAVLVVVLATALAARGILTSMSPSLLRAAADDVD